MTEPTLREILARLHEMDRRVEQRFQYSDKAIDKAEAAMNERLAGMNEFRDTLRDQAGRMATRVELDALNATVEGMRREKSNTDGRLAVVAFVVSIMASLLVAWLSSVIRGS